MIRPGYVRVLFHKELLRFLANPGLWILLVLFLCMGVLVSVSDVILDRDGFTLVVVEGGPSDFLAFVARNETGVSVLGPGAFRSSRDRNRVVAVRILTPSFDEALRSGETASLELSSAELPRADLMRLRDLLVKNAHLYLDTDLPLDVRLAPASGPRGQATPRALLQAPREPEGYKRMIMALLIAVSLNIITFNLFTVSFVEEKQNRTLLAVLLSPARSTEAAAAKGLFFLLPGLMLPACLAGVYRPDVLAQPVFWIAIVAGALLYMSMALLIVSFVERQSTASLICLGYLFFLTSLFILAPRFTALVPLKNLLPENFIFSTVSFLFDGTPFSSYASFFLGFLVVAVLAPIGAVRVFTHRTMIRRPRETASPPQWTLTDWLTILGLCLLFHYLLSPLIASLLRSLPGLTGYGLEGLLLLFLGVFAVPLIVILPLYTRLKFGTSLYALAFRSASPLRDIRTGLLWFGLYVSCMMLVSAIVFTGCLPEAPSSALSLLERLHPQQARFLHAVQTLLHHLGAGSWLLFGLVMVVLVPVLEEAYFRGCLLPALEHRWGPRVGLIGSALAFGIFHLNPLLLPVYFVLGLLAGLLYRRTGNLLAPVTFHALNNLTSLLALGMMF